MEQDDLREILADIGSQLDPAHLSKLVAFAKLILEAQRQGLDWPANKKFTQFSEKNR